MTLQNTIRLTERIPQKKKILLAEKQVKSAKRPIELLIKRSISKQRAFHRLNHFYISNSTGEIYFSLLAIMLQMTIRLTECMPQKEKFFAGLMKGFHISEQLIVPILVKTNFLLTAKQ